MKTLFLTAITLSGIAFSTPQAQARDRKHYYSSSHYSHGCENQSYHHGYYRGDGGPRVSYYRSEPSYYYRPSSRYYSSYRCEPVYRHSFRPPLISFLFGF